MRRIFLIALIAVAGLLLEPRSASAHIFLEKAQPGADAQLAQPPQALVLEFDGPVEGVKVEIALYDSAGHRLATNADKGTTVNWATVTIPLPSLAPGAYRVTWFVNLMPGHETNGEYRFKILG